MKWNNQQSIITMDEAKDYIKFGPSSWIKYNKSLFKIYKEMYNDFYNIKFKSKIKHKRTWKTIIENDT